MGKHTEQRIVELASQAHNRWRATRWLPEGGYDPRIKTTKDEAWIAAHGTNQVDIANTTYIDLPSDWQAENRASAEVAIDLVEWQMRERRALDSAFVESASAIVHNRWVERNPWADDSLKVKYSLLPEAEKEKDRVIVRDAIAICTK